MARDNTFCIIGINTFGESLANQLNDLGANVVVIDKDEDVIKRLNNKFDTAIAADATNIAALKSIGVQDINTVIVSISDFETSIYVCSNLKDLHVPNVIVYAKSSMQTKILRNIGVNSVITPEIHSAKSLSLQLFSQTDIQDTFIGNGYSLVKVFVNRYNNGIFINEVSKKLPYISLFCIKRGNRIIFPSALNKIEMGDILFIACESKWLPSVVRFFYVSSEQLE